MTTTLGGVTVADPDVPIDIENVLIGAYTESHDGTLLLQYTNVKLKFRARWTILPEAERNTLRARLDVVTSQAFKPPHTATTYTVLVKQDSIKERPEPTSGTTSYYALEAELEEAA